MRKEKLYIPFATEMLEKSKEKIESEHTNELLRDLISRVESFAEDGWTRMSFVFNVSSNAGEDERMKWSDSNLKSVSSIMKSKGYSFRYVSRVEEINHFHSNRRIKVRIGWDGE